MRRHALLEPACKRRLYANTAPFYRRDLSVRRLWPPVDTEGSPCVCCVAVKGMPARWNARGLTHTGLRGNWVKCLPFL